MAQVAQNLTNGYGSKKGRGPKLGILASGKVGQAIPNLEFFEKSLPFDSSSVCVYAEVRIICRLSGSIARRHRLERSAARWPQAPHQPKFGIFERATRRFAQCGLPAASVQQGCVLPRRPRHRQLVLLENPRSVQCNRGSSICCSDCLKTLSVACPWQEAG